jgi:hypothetical protein
MGRLIFFFSCSEICSHGLDDAFCGATLVLKLIMTDGIIAFAIWGLGPLMRLGRTLLLKNQGYNLTLRSTIVVSMFPV